MILKYTDVDMVTGKSEEAQMAEVVLVTGGTGFVAGWCIVELLERGYAVRATVRDLASEAAVRAGDRVRHECRQTA